MVSLILLTLLAAPVPCEAKGPKKVAKPSVPILAFASSEELKSAFKGLGDAAQDNRTVGSPGGRRAYEYLLAQAKSIPGWTLREESFTPDVDFALKGYETSFAPFAKLDKTLSAYVKNKRAFDRLSAFATALKGKTLSNIVLRKEGLSPAWASMPVVVTAHFDTITWRRSPFDVLPEVKAPGANANGAGVVALLAIARALKDLKPRRPLELVFTDAGEVYFLGAHAHAAALASADVRAEALALDLIGWDRLTPNRINLYVRSEGQPGSEKDRALANALGAAFNREGLEAHIVRNNTDRSEHYAFWRSFHAGVLVSEDWEYGFDDAYYHTARDSAETVDWLFAAKVGKGVASTLAGYAADAR